MFHSNLEAAVTLPVHTLNNIGMMNCITRFWCNPKPPNIQEWKLWILYFLVQTQFVTTHPLRIQIPIVDSY
jgi:hypothetical protein